MLLDVTRCCSLTGGRTSSLVLLTMLGLNKICVLLKSSLVT